MIPGMTGSVADGVLNGLQVRFVSGLGLQIRIGGVLGEDRGVTAVGEINPLDGRQGLAQLALVAGGIVGGNGAAIQRVRSGCGQGGYGRSRPLPGAGLRSGRG